MDPIRKECEQKPDAVVMFEKLEECNTRVSAKTETEETCAQELYDYIHHVDHCVSFFLSDKLLFPQSHTDGIHPI